MRENLIVPSDRFVVDGCNAERARDLQSIGRLWQLPQPAEQAVRHAAREHDRVSIGDPQRLAREHRQLVRAFARRDDRQLVAARRAQVRERAGEAARRGRRAHGRAELHEALVQISRRRVGRQRAH